MARTRRLLVKALYRLQVTVVSSVLTIGDVGRVADMRWHLWDELQQSLKDPVDEGSAAKLPLEVDSLETRFRTIDKKALTTESEKGIYDDVFKLFEARKTKELTWEERYRVETEIGYLRSSDRLRLEITSRLRWAKADGVPQAGDLDIAYLDLLKTTEPSKPTDDVLRDLLLEVMDAIHAHRRRKYIVGKLLAKATSKTLFLVLIVLLVVFGFLVSGTKTDVRPASVASLKDVSILPIAFVRSGEFWSHFGLYASAIFGLLGALFSRLLTTLKPRSVTVLDELYNAATFRYILLRGTIGVLGALVIYFFLQSGLVEGSVFPKFDQLGMKLVSFGGSHADNWPTQLLLPSGSMALLIMWSFIAGFSESLVPTILENVERQLGGAISSRQQA
jgi:hypothetical protein